MGGDLTTQIGVGDTGTGGQLVGVGEELSKWLSEMVSLGDALTLWDPIREGDIKTLAKHIEWKKDSVALRWEGKPYDYQDLIASRDHNPATFEGLKPGSIVEPAMAAVLQIINDHLYKKRRAAPKLVLRDNRPVLCLTPPGLIDAIWLDFALAVSGNIDYRRCVRCGAAFPVPPKGKRKRFCSNRCRVATHREKRALLEQDAQ